MGAIFFQSTRIGTPAVSHSLMASTRHPLSHQAVNLMTALYRRQFLTTAAAGVAAPFILDSLIHAQDRQGQGPNNRINLGFIGVGMMGRGHLGSFLGNRATQVVAISDVHRVRLTDAVDRVHPAYAA